MVTTLYAKASGGKIKVWHGYADNGTVYTKYGFLDGKMQYAERKCYPKNVGKSNETTAKEQAESELLSKIDRQIDKGYRYKIEETEEKLFLPMLCHDYNKHGKKIVFPCYVQPKLDGIRALWINQKFYSRKGKIIEPLQELANQIGRVFVSPELQNNLILDGELYSERLTFQENVSAIKRKQESTDLIYYNIYDFNYQHDSEWIFKDRYDVLSKFFKNYYDSNSLIRIRQVQTYICLNEEDLKLYHRDFLNQGYEGTIIRNIEGLYRFDYRSYDVQKYKDFITEEFKIIDFTSGEGFYSNLVIWICETSDKKQFNVVPKGTFEQKEEWLHNGNKYIGKMLTVRYFELTDDGLPRFPVGIEIRDYE